MARIDMETQERMQADARGKHRQDKKAPLLIRDDGMLYPNLPLVRKNPRFRVYHGNPKASLADRMRYLQGLGAKREVVFTEEPAEPFDIGKASLEELMTFATEQYGAVLDPNKPLAQLRKDLFRLSQLPDPTIALPDPSPSAPAPVEAADEQRAIEADPPIRGGRQTRKPAAGLTREAA